MNRFRRSVQTVLKHYYKIAEVMKFGAKRDWGERAFRFWLVQNLFIKELKWDPYQIVFGEAYDVLFLDLQMLPSIYLETKRPGDGLKDLKEFKGRLSGYPTLRAAALTDGHEWLIGQVRGGKLSDTIRFRVDYEDGKKETIIEKILSPIKGKEVM